MKHRYRTVTSGLVGIALNAMALLFLICAGTPATAQDCPKSNASGPTVPSRMQVLEGRLVYHDGIRQWFELKLDHPRCAANSVQVIRSSDNWKPLQVLRGCHVRSTGPIDESETGYYSLDLYQDSRKIVPLGACRRQPRLPGRTKVRPDPRVRNYTVHMDVDYRPGDHPVRFRVRASGRELQPWQAYASYELTGGYVLYGLCGDGFVVDRVFGTRTARPGHFDDPRASGDMAMFDPETAATSGTTNLHLGYTCVRLGR